MKQYVNAEDVLTIMTSPQCNADKVRAFMALPTIEILDTLDFQSLFLMGNTIEILFPDGHIEIAQSESDIANMDGLAKFRVVDNTQVGTQDMNKEEIELEIELGMKCCNEFVCGECPYEKYDDGHYKMRCIHILMKDINELYFGGKK